MCGFIEEKEPYDSWELLVRDLQLNWSETKIYRGQSNSESIIAFKPWDVVSSFNRKYHSNRYHFRNFLNQQLHSSLFKEVYGDYPFEKMERFLEFNQLEKLYFLQHYGIPTCLIDFSKNPLVALYFAIAGVVPIDTNKLYQEEKPEFYPTDHFVSIYEVDYHLLNQLLGVKHLDYNDFPGNYSKYEFNYGYIGLDIDPLKNCSNPNENYNLENQKGCFILFDNERWDMDFITTLKLLMREYRDLRTSPIVRIYKLKYNAIFTMGEGQMFKHKRLFGYLHSNNYTGRRLFNDLQGIRYDFDSFHLF